MSSQVDLASALLPVGHPEKEGNGSNLGLSLMSDFLSWAQRLEALHRASASARVPRLLVRRLPGSVLCRGVLRLFDFLLFEEL